MLSSIDGPIEHAETGPRAGLARRFVEATTGFEPVNRGFAVLAIASASVHWRSI